jgi:pimeloyl-ACP methyl ester carboxylesterase
LFGAYGHFRSWVVQSDQLEAALERLEKNWGTGETLALFAPSLIHDDAYKRRHARFKRLSASPSSATALMRMNSEIDVRPIVPSIRVPTLIIHREGDVRVKVEAGGFWLIKSQMRSMSSCLEMITCCGSATRNG